MHLTKEQFSVIEKLINGKFNQSGEMQARIVSRDNRVNDEEIYRKIYEHVNEDKTLFLDGDVEFNAQEKAYLKTILEEDMPGVFTRVAKVILRAMEEETV